MPIAARTRIPPQKAAPPPPRILVPGQESGVEPPASLSAIATFTVDRASPLAFRWAFHRECPEVPPFPAEVVDPFGALDAALRRGHDLPGDRWAAMVSYDLGSAVEPRLARPMSVGELPLIELHRVDSCERIPLNSPSGGEIRTRPVLKVESRDAYTRAVERALEYIRAGDIYQANIAHRLSATLSGSGPEIYSLLARHAAPRHGIYIESAALPGGDRFAVASLSPELFLSFDARTRRLTTRPMKGTRPGTADPAELRDAEKDRAELAMIVDLMRNDLGRVCEFGSVRVDAEREIERHATGPGEVLQATATVSGVVREGVSPGEILRATFPPGSVTGTPKIRAMQIIAELEPFTRGPYCGCVGVFRDDGSFDLGVSIRTGLIRGRIDVADGAFLDAGFSYCVGAGIVADSDPESEWRETLSKARVLEPAFTLDPAID